MRQNTYQARSRDVFATARPWFVLATFSVLLASVSIIPDRMESSSPQRQRRLDEWDWSFLSDSSSQQNEKPSPVTPSNGVDNKDDDWHFMDRKSEPSPVATSNNAATDDWDAPNQNEKRPPASSITNNQDDDWNVVTESSKTISQETTALGKDEWGLVEETQSVPQDTRKPEGSDVNDDDWHILDHETHPASNDTQATPKTIADDDDGEWLLTKDVTKESHKSYAKHEHDNIHKHQHSVFTEEHKDLFPFSWSDFGGFTLATAGLLLAAGGGIGGGGILVPIYCLVLDFSPKHAIPLSNITVLGGALANTILNASKRHPTADRPLIDWDMILVMEPLTIAGALIGALINKVLPELLLTVLLVLLLAITAQNTLAKAIQLYRKETAQMDQESELTKLVEDQQRNDDDDNEEDNENQETTGDEPNESQSDQMVTVMSKEHEELQEILEQERHHSQHHIILLVVMFVVVLIINVTKGGGAFKSPLGITCGSTAFWMSNFLLLAWILAISVHARVVLLHKYERKAACNYVYQSGDIVWDERATVVYPIICTFAGFFAGMFGVGGGIVKGPLMLAMGIHPAVSSASTACMILFTSFTATTSFVVFGLLVYDYAIICFIIGFLATLVGQIALTYVMKRAGRNSYIAFSIGGVVLVSAILMTIQSLLSIAEGETHHAGGICGKGD